MAIPLATTTVTIKGKRPQSSIDPEAEGYDPIINDDPWIIATGVRASITLPQGTRSNPDSDAMDVYAFKCDLVETDVSRFDTIIDETTEIEYLVATAQHSHPTLFGLEHITGRIYVTKGLRPEGGGTVVTA